MRFKNALPIEATGTCKNTTFPSSGSTARYAFSTSAARTMFAAGNSKTVCRLPSLNSSQNAASFTCGVSVAVGSAVGAGAVCGADVT